MTKLKVLLLCFLHFKDIFNIQFLIEIVLNVDPLWFKARILIRNLQKGNGASGKNQCFFFHFVIVIIIHKIN
jgi:hypothetical protein